MDFDDLPSIFIRHGGKTCEFHTSIGLPAFVLSLRHHFGVDAVPDGKEIFLVTESTGVGPSGESLPTRKAPLDLFLVNKAKSQRVFTMEFSNASSPENPSNLNSARVKQDRSFTLPAEVRPQDTKRAAEIRKGRQQTNKVDANGVSLSKVGQNAELLLTHTERVEMEKYILYLHWELDPATGIPYLQGKQDQASVRLSLYEMGKNPILRSRPERALRRAAQRRVSELNNKDNVYQPGLDMLKLKAKGFVLGKTSALTGSVSIGKKDTKCSSGISPSSDHMNANGKRDAPDEGDEVLQKKSQKTDKKNTAGSLNDNSLELPKPLESQKAGPNSISKGRRKAGSVSKKGKTKRASPQKGKARAGRKNSNQEKPVADPSKSGSASDTVSDDSLSGDDSSAAESPAKRSRHPSAKVVANEELAADAVAQKQKGKAPQKPSKKAQVETERLAARALQERAVAEVLSSLGASGSRSLPDVATTTDVIKVQAAMKPFGFPDDSLGSVTLNIRNVRTLEDGAQLMDDIVDFFSKFIQLVELPAKEQEHILCFNAFIYTKLLAVAKQIAGCKRPALDEMYKPVFAWVKGDDVFNKNSILFPILDSNHWSLVVAYKPGAGIAAAGEKPCFLHFNSVPGTHETAVDTIRMFLSELFLHTNKNVLRPAKRAAPLKYFSKTCMPGIEILVPEQDNDHDCGLFTMEYAEQYIKHTPVKIDIKKKRLPIEDLLQMERSVFEPAQVSQKRAYVRQLILTIGQELESGRLARPLQPAALRSLAERARAKSV